MERINKTSIQYDIENMTRARLRKKNPVKKCENKNRKKDERKQMDGMNESLTLILHKLTYP